MNSRPIYTILISFCITIALIIGLYYYGNTPDKITSPANFKNTVIQLLPRPIILDNNSTSLKNNALENLLTSKSEKTLSITETDIDFSNIISIFPFQLQKMSMHFHYNQSEDRVDFKGENNSNQHLEISGYYKHTMYNQTHYVINIINDHNELNINALYTPSTKENATDSVTGQFLLKTNFSSLFKYSASKEDIALTGDFYKTDSTLKLHKVNFSSNNGNVSAEIEIDNTNTVSNLVISNINLNDIEKNINLANIYNEIFENFLPLSQSSTKLSITLQNVSYSDLKIKEGLIKISTGDNKILINNIALLTDEDIKLSSKGDIIATPFSLEYEGIINASNLSTESLKSLMNIEDSLTDTSRDIEIISKIKLSPPLLHLIDLKVVQSFSETLSDLKQYASNGQYITQIRSEIKNLRQTSTKPSFIDILLKKYNNIFQINNEKNNQQNFLHARLNFSTITNYDNIKFDNVSFNYTSTPNLIRLSNIETKSPNLNIEGNLSFDTNQAPITSITFKGKNSDPFMLYSLLKSNILNCAQLEDCKATLQNIIKFKGNIDLNIEGNSQNSTPISSLNCSATLDSTLNLDRCTAKLFDGSVSMTGDIKIDNQVHYSISYELLKAKAQTLIQYLFTDKIKADGYFDTIKGNLISFGLDKESFIKNLEGNAHVKATNFKMEKLDLKKLIQKYDHKAFLNTNPKNTSKKNQPNNLFEISNLDSKFTINKGEAKSSIFSFETNDHIKANAAKVEYNLLSDSLLVIIGLKYTTSTGGQRTINLSATGSIADLNLNTKQK